MRSARQVTMVISAHRVVHQFAQIQAVIRIQQSARTVSQGNMGTHVQINVLPTVWKTIVSSQMETVFLASKGNIVASVTEIAHPDVQI